MKSYFKIERRRAIRLLIKDLEDELVITSPGMISRELYHIWDRPENFYMMGSMSCALGFGIGLALNTNRDIIVIIGDGDALMSLGTFALMNKLKLPNLSLCILDNNSYQSTGNQQTCSDAINFRELAECYVIYVYSKGKPYPRIDIPHKEIAKRFYETING